MNYLQMNDKGKLGHDEQKLADFFGEGNYTPFYKKHLLQNKIKLTRDDFVAGEIPVMFNAMKKLGIDYKHDDYPEPLKKYLHRRIWETKLSYMKDKAFNDYLTEPVFIKPKDKLKKFTGFVLNSRDDWYLTDGAGDGTNIVCSEPVKWVTEYRIPVIHNVPMDFCNYFGDPKIRPDMGAVKNMVADWAPAGAPASYCLDVGVLDTGETALIEVNDAFSCGSYTMKSGTYAVLLMARWDELLGKISDISTGWQKILDGTVGGLS